MLCGYRSISHALDTSVCNITKMKCFAAPEKVWCHRRRCGWRHGVVAYRGPPTIMGERQKKHFSTYSTLVCIWYGDCFLSHPVRMTYWSRTTWKFFLKGQTPEVLLLLTSSIKIVLHSNFCPAIYLPSNRCHDSLHFNHLPRNFG